MKFTDPGTETAEAVRQALEKSSGPKLAARGGCGVQSLYDVRDFHLPGRLLIPVIARAVGMTRAAFADMVARDRNARAHLHAPRRNEGARA